MCSPVIIRDFLVFAVQLVPPTARLFGLSQAVLVASAALQPCGIDRYQVMEKDTFGDDHG